MSGIQHYVASVDWKERNTKRVQHLDTLRDDLVFAITAGNQGQLEQLRGQQNQIQVTVGNLATREDMQNIIQTLIAQMRALEQQKLGPQLNGAPLMLSQRAVNPAWVQHGATPTRPTVGNRDAHLHQTPQQIVPHLPSRESIESGKIGVYQTQTGRPNARGAGELHQGSLVRVLGVSPTKLTVTVQSLAKPDHTGSPRATSFTPITDPEQLLEQRVRWHAENDRIPQPNFY